MTGQVKEDILSRFGELGVSVKDGLLRFAPSLLKRTEFIAEPTTFNYKDHAGRSQAFDVAANSLCFTYCQVPVVYHIDDEGKTEVVFNNGERKELSGNHLDKATSYQVFQRTGDILKIRVGIEAKTLK